MEERPTTPFGQYQLIEKIAQGGMAEIFRGKAMDEQGLERPIVIKRILPHIAASPEFVDMLVDEAKIAVMLSHGNIAQIYDLGKVADDYFIVMEYVDGKTLSQIMKRLRTQGRLMPIPYAVSLCLEIASALDYMHRKTDENGNPLHIIHRDISPQNAILSTAGTVKIIDFGIAKAKTKVSTTDSGVLKGKFAYMSPEHAEGLKLDHRTDIFSLGIILFELLTGQRLFKGKNNIETIRRVKKAKVPTPSGVRSAIPRALDKIVFTALQRDRDRRYPSAGDFAQDLTRFLVTQYPDFRTQEFVSYLQDLFPEIAPQEKTVHEETPRFPHEIRRETKGIDQEGDENPALPVRGAGARGAPEAPPLQDEETVAADSEVIRTKLKETEVFEVAGAERREEKEEESPVAPEDSEEEGTWRIRTRPTLRIVIGLVSLGLLALAIWLGVRHAPQIGKTTPLFRAAQLKEILKRQTPEKPPEPPVPEPPKKAVALVPPPHPPAPPPASASLGSGGSLIVDSQPQGAKIFINDADTNRVTPFTFDQLPPGPRKVGLFLDNYRFWEGRTDVTPNKAVKLSAPLAINDGDLEVDSLPPGAEVILNGKPSGKTPFRLNHLAPGSIYEVTLRLDGYEIWTGSSKIFGGRTEVISASLKKRRPPGSDDSLP